jgi:hypothetical protein
MLNDAIDYPFRGSGKYMLVIGAVLSMFLTLFSIAPVIGIIATIASSGFFASYLFEIVNSTAFGKNEPCDWPDIKDFWSDIFSPWICILSSTLFSLGPFLLTVILRFPSLIVFGFLLFGLFLLPMSILSVAVYQQALAAFWTVTIPAIKRCLPQYLVLFVIISFITLVNLILIRVLSNIPVFGWIIQFFLDMYVLMMNGRILGLFYRSNKAIFEFSS